MPRRPLQSPLAIVILGLLAEQAQHPYGMRVLMRDRGHDRLVGRGPASLYDAVRRLTAAGLVEPQESRQEGRRPERTVYRITVAGARSLQEWVRDGLADPDRGEQFTAALSFMYVLDLNEVMELLTRRAAHLDERLRTSEVEMGAALSAGVPPIFLSEGRYSLALVQAERAWLDTFIEQLSTGALAWPRPGTAHDEEQA